jgi:hypothetical protein
MSNADKTKLDAVETGATADQTGAQIKSAYEAETNTNAFTDTEQTKLGSLSLAAQTPAGGTAGQVLKKNSGTDYDYGWAVDVTGGGGSQSLGNLTSTGGTLADVDLSVTQSFYVNAGENITTVNVVNGPSVGTVVEWVLIVAANGANRDITLPAGWRTPGGVKTFTVASGESRVIAVLETGSATRANISDDLS